MITIIHPVFMRYPVNVCLSCGVVIDSRELAVCSHCAESLQSVPVVVRVVVPDSEVINPGDLSEDVDRWD